MKACFGIGNGDINGEITSLNLKTPLNYSLGYRVTFEYQCLDIKTQIRSQFQLRLAWSVRYGFQVIFIEAVSRMLAPYPCIIPTNEHQT